MEPDFGQDTPLGEANIYELGATLRARQDKMQKKTFTNWYNSYLAPRGLKVKDLFTDLGNGIVLFNLLEALSNEKLSGKLTMKPRFQAQELENLTHSFKFLRSKNFKITAGPEDIRDGNESMILGFSWMLILRFEVQKFSADIQELLKWCQNRTKPYDNVDVKNFKTSFQDGLALNALIHRHLPHLVPNYDQLDPNDKLGNLNQAFEVAERELGVPRLLDAEDVAENPDEKSVIVYVARLRQALADHEDRLAEEEDALRRRQAEEDAARRKAQAEEDARRRAAEEAAAAEAARKRAEEEARRRAEEEAARRAAEDEARRRAAEEAAARRAQEMQDALDNLNKLIPPFIAREEHQKATDDQAGDYVNKAKPVKEWPANKAKELEDDLNRGNLPETEDDILAKLADLERELGEAEDDKLAVEGDAKDVDSRRAKEHRPAAQHDENSTPAINDEYRKLRQIADGYKKALTDKQHHAKKLGPDLERFRRMTARLRGWADSQFPMVKDTVLGNSVGECHAILGNHEKFQKDFGVQGKTLNDAMTLGRNLGDIPEVVDTCSELRNSFGPIQGALSTKLSDIHRELERQKRLEAARLKFFDEACVLDGHIQAGQEYLDCPSLSDREEDIGRLVSELSRTFNALTAAPVEGLSPDEIENARRLVERQASIVPELMNRQRGVREQKTKEARVNDLLHRQNQALQQAQGWLDRNAANVSQDGPPEELLRRVNAVQTKEGDRLVDNAKAIEREIADLDPTAINPHTSMTAASMDKQNKHLNKWLESRKDILGNALEPTDRAAVIANMNVLSDDQVSIEDRVLRDGLEYTNANYTCDQMSPVSADGKYEIEKFNPFPNDPQRRPTSAYGAPKASTTTYNRPTSQSYDRPSPQPAYQAPSQPAYQAPSQPAYQAPQQAYQRPSSAAYERPPTQAAYERPQSYQRPAPSTYDGPSNPSYRNQPSNYQTPPSAGTSRSPNRSRAPSVSASPHFDENTRKSKEMEPGVILYTTQTMQGTHPFAHRYELEVRKNEGVDFSMDFTGSQNIKLVYPPEAEGSLVTPGLVTRPGETNLITICQQENKFEPAAVRMKFSWIDV